MGSSNFNVELAPDHLHGDDAVPMQVVEATSGQSHDGVNWFRYTFLCRCGEQVVVLLRTKNDMKIPGLTELVERTP